VKHYLSTKHYNWRVIFEGGEERGVFVWVDFKYQQYSVGLGNKYRFLDINRFSFLQTDIDS